MKKKLSDMVFFVFLLLCIYFVFTNFSLVRQGVIYSVELFYKNVLTSLLPFFFLSSMVVTFSKQVFKQSKKNVSFIVCLFVILLCGSPSGARSVSEAKKNGSLTTSQADSLFCLCQNTSPLYLWGVVGIVLLKSKTLGVMVLLASYLSLFFVGIVFLKNLTVTAAPLKKNEEGRTGIIQCICSSVASSVGAALGVGAYIVFFNLIITILSSCGVFSFLGWAFSFLGRQKVLLFFKSIIEMSCVGGEIAKLGEMRSMFFLLGFSSVTGGISMAMQNLFFMEGEISKTSLYIKAKILYCVFSFGILLVCCLFI